MSLRFGFAFVLAFASAAPALAEGALPAPGTAATTIRLGSDGEHPSSGAVVFRNAGTASQRLLLADRDRGVACTPDGDRTSRSRPGQFTIAGGAELACTAEPGTHRFTAYTSEGGSVRESSGRIVVR